MSEFRHYEISQAAVKKAYDFGIGTSLAVAEERVKRMAQRAAIITHRDGNRRFEHYILRVEGDKVTDINRR